MNARNSNLPKQWPRSQRGITTLAITLILLGIVTVIVLFATNVAFFEQRTTTNQNRAVSTEQMAEYAVSLGGQFLNANRAVVVKTAIGGWLTGGTRRWVACPSGALAAGHPCSAERDPVRRAGLYYYDNDVSTPAVEGIPYDTLTASVGGILTGADTSSRFNGTTTLNALLCRVGYSTTNPTVPECQLNPTAAGNVAVTLIANAQVAGESAAATVKETWATAMTMNPSAPVPLIASGVAEGLGNAQIVAAPNAGGYGVAASIWSPNDIDIGSSGPSACGAGGLGSVTTCHLGEYLQSTPRTDLKTTCATSNNACGCPAVSASGVDFLSGHSQSVRKESLDILDRDGGCGALPDITFFPRDPYDDPNDPSDDSLFEYIFDVDYVMAEGGSTVLNNCGPSGTDNCAAFALINDYNATVLPNCSSLGTSSSGIFYVTGDCDLNSTGSATASVILVVDGEVRINGNVDFFGMLFARSNDNTAEVRGNGNVKIFGSLAVEGDVNITGSIDLVYDNTSASGNAGGAIPDSVKFGRVTGSWLDSQSGI
jgi:hypothetical protein